MLQACVYIFVVSCLLPLLAFGGMYKCSFSRTLAYRNAYRMRPPHCDPSDWLV